VSVSGQVTGPRCITVGRTVTGRNVFVLYCGLGLWIFDDFIVFKNVFLYFYAAVH
jgi:hypothetical protein